MTVHPANSTARPAVSIAVNVAGDILAVAPLLAKAGNDEQ